MASYSTRSVFDDVLKDHLNRAMLALGGGRSDAYNQVVSLECFVFPYIKEDKEFMDKRKDLNVDYENKIEDALKNSKDESVTSDKRRNAELKLAMELFREINVAMKNRNIHPASQDYDSDEI